MSGRDFDGRTVMITGASGNLGRAVTAAFRARGANVALVDRHRDHLESAFGSETRDMLFVTADLVDAAGTARAAQSAAERFRRIDVLANLAGGFRMGEPVHRTND